jgi:hypothetical protein
MNQSVPYQIATDGGIVRLEDAVWIPPDETNESYREYLRWLAAGNQPLPADPPQDTS